MRTQTLVEGILYVSGNHPSIREAFEICHVINDTDRNWQSVPHIELFYLDHFKRPDFLAIVDKRLHVYVIGDQAKGRKFNIISIDGFQADHMTMSKSELRGKIYQDARDSKDIYLPEASFQRIIFIQPDYTKETISDNDIFIFNRQSSKGTLFTKSNWSLGPDIYSVDIDEYETSAHEILKAVAGDIE